MKSYEGGKKSRSRVVGDVVSKKIDLENDAMVNWKPMKRR